MVKVKSVYIFAIITVVCVVIIASLTYNPNTELNVNDLDEDEGYSHLPDFFVPLPGNFTDIDFKVSIDPVNYTMDKSIVAYYSITNIGKDTLNIENPDLGSASNMFDIEILGENKSIYTGSGGHFGISPLMTLEPNQTYEWYYTIKLPMDASYISWYSFNSSTGEKTDYDFKLGEYWTYGNYSTYIERVDLSGNITQEHRWVTSNIVPFRIIEYSEPMLNNCSLAVIRESGKYFGGEPVNVSIQLTNHGNFELNISELNEATISLVAGGYDVRHVYTRIITNTTSPQIIAIQPNETITLSLNMKDYDWKCDNCGLILDNIENEISSVFAKYESYNGEVLYSNYESLWISDDTPP